MKDVQTHLCLLEAEAIEIMREAAKLMKDAGLIVITAFTSSFRSERQMLRDMMAPGEFVEGVCGHTPVRRGRMGRQRLSCQGALWSAKELHKDR